MNTCDPFSAGNLGAARGSGSSGNSFSDWPPAAKCLKAEPSHRGCRLAPTHRTCGHRVCHTWLRLKRSCGLAQDIERLRVVGFEEGALRLIPDDDADEREEGFAIYSRQDGRNARLPGANHSAFHPLQPLWEGAPLCPELVTEVTGHAKTKPPEKEG